MDQNGKEVYTMFNALKSVSQFSFRDLRTLLSLNRPNYQWDDGMKLMAIVSNLGLGRPTAPNLVDAIIADRRTAEIEKYMFRIVDPDPKTPRPGQIRDIVFEVLVPTSTSNSSICVGSFSARLNAPGEERDWVFASTLADSLKVFTIADRVRIGDGQNGAFEQYTIFDNVTQSQVYLDGIGVDYLKALSEQIRMYAGLYTQELYDKFLVYATALLEQHRDYTLQVTYRPMGTKKVLLQAGVVWPRHDAAVRSFDPIATFQETLLKGD